MSNHDRLLQVWLFFLFPPIETAGMNFWFFFRFLFFLLQHMYIKNTNNNKYKNIYHNDNKFQHIIHNVINYRLFIFGQFLLIWPVCQHNPHSRGVGVLSTTSSTSSWSVSSSSLSLLDSSSSSWMLSGMSSNYRKDSDTATMWLVSAYRSY